MPKMYVNKAELSRCFGISPPTVYKRVAGIEEEIKKGRYNRYAIADGLVSMAVFVDYRKYHKRLNDKNLNYSAISICSASALRMESS